MFDSAKGFEHKWDRKFLLGSFADIAIWHQFHIGKFPQMCVHTVPGPLAYEEATFVLKDKRSNVAL
jgi:hypothetical protein